MDSTHAAYTAALKQGKVLRSGAINGYSIVTRYDDIDGEFTTEIFHYESEREKRYVEVRADHAASCQVELEVMARHYPQHLRV